MSNGGRGKGAGFPDGRRKKGLLDLALARKTAEADAFAAAIHAGHEQNRRRRGNRDVLREELAVARFDAGLRFGFAHEREAAVRVQIDDSPAGFDFIRRDESGRNGQITEIGGPGPADAFEAAALMQRVLEFFEPGAELAVCRIPARRIIPAPQFAEEIVGRSEFRLVLPDFGFEPLLFAAQRVDFAEQGLLVDAFAPDRREPRRRFSPHPCCARFPRARTRRR